MDYKLYRSNRKTISLSVSKDLTVVVKAPARLSKSDIDSFVVAHRNWIDKHLALMKERLISPPAVIGDEEKKRLVERAAAILPERCAFFSREMGLSYSGITLTAAKTRWGSCSPKNRLCFSFRLMLLSDDLIDYIIVHELAHTVEKNHGAGFYSIIEKTMPDYRERVKRLRQEERGLNFE